ncbi:MAG: GNAT family N-acetyltransferase, partial [Myxococcota bacterium]
MRFVERPTDADWGAAQDGAWARAFLQPMLEDGVTAHLSNVHTDLRIAIVEDQVLPYTINDGKAPNAWVVSPRNAYVDYAGEELRELNNPVLRGTLKAALSGLGAVLDAGKVDRLVCIDNWCVSTNLHPHLSSDSLRALTLALVDQFPSHALAWRSVHQWRDEPLAAQLQAAGYRPVPARSCWVWDPNDPHHRAAKNLKHDRRHLRNSGYEVIGPDSLTAEDAPRLRSLYDALYLDKYSKHNPAMTDRFLRAALAGALHVRALRKDGRIDAVLGFFCRAGFMTTPLFGYDTTLPQDVGLYRMLSQALVQESIA